MGLLIWPLALALFATTSCSRPGDVPTEEGAAQTDQAPFHDDASSPMDSAPAKTNASGPVLPFHDSEHLPAGTLIMVRLKEAIAARDSGVPTSFEGTLDEPVVIRGKTLLPRGATVSGRVESFRSSKLKPARGYIRLTLESVQSDSLDLPLQTASLFVRPAPQQDPSDSTIRVAKGHRLTFRLAEPVYLATQRAQASR
ncbi:MAG: hypothetical protein WAM79_04530 [Candidatus Sulfotelmatobacter sp.]